MTDFSSGSSLRGESFSADISIKLLRHENSGAGCIRVVPEQPEMAESNLCPAPFLCPSRRMLLDYFHCFRSVWLEKSSVASRRVPVRDITSCWSAAASFRQEAVRGRQQRSAAARISCADGRVRVPQLVLSQQRPFLFADSLTQLGAALMSVGSWG